MVDKKYDSVEFSEDEMNLLKGDLLQEVEVNDGKIETTASQVEQTADEPSDKEVSEPVVEDKTEVSAGAETSEEDSFDGFEIDGIRYDKDTILAWQKDSNNRAEWNKSNTQKAQSLSKWKSLADKVKSDEAFRNHIKDFYYDNPDEMAKLGLDNISELEAEVENAKVPNEIETRLNVLEKVEADRIMETRVEQLDTKLSTLEQKYPDYLGDGKVQEFLDFADKNAHLYVENGMPNLDRAFKEWSYGQMSEKLAHYKKLEKNGMKNEGKVINESQAGAKEVKTPKRVKSWDDVNMNNPEISKYFND